MSDDALTLDSTAFVTFYSFKGGVGRSMALINVAGIMAGRGFRVLALDMDLEAPGISYLMRHEAKLGGQILPGFVDLLSDACERGEQADLFALSGREVIERYSYAYTIPEPIRQSTDGLLRIMPAGQFDDHYQERLDKLSLGQLYRDGQGQPLIHALKQVIASAGMFDFVFIDSRTGFSDESGICTRDLGDHLVVIMGLNRQNQEGTAAFLRSLRDSGTQPNGLRIVLSPVPNGEDELLEKREKEAASVLSKALGRKVNLELQIPYHPRLALTEEPHIFRRSRGYLYEAYAEIERAVLAMLGLTTGILRKDIVKAVEDKQQNVILRHLLHLQKLDRGLGEVTSLAGSELFEFSLSDDAKDLRQHLAKILPGDSWPVLRLADKLHDREHLDADLFYRRALEALTKSPRVLGNYALFLTDIRKDHDAAEDLYKRALEADPKNANNLGNYAVFLQNIRKDHDAAEGLYKRVLEADPKDVTVLGNYAIFLTDIRQDHDTAEGLYKRALEANPKDANDLGNYAKLLFLLARASEAEQRLKEAWAQQPAEKNLQCELHFYAYCHMWQQQPEALPSLKVLLESGARSDQWPLEENVKAGIQAGHPHPEFLSALAAVVSAKADIATLARFEEWTQSAG